jgi:hypothetical protein
MLLADDDVNDVNDVNDANDDADDADDAKANDDRSRKRKGHVSTLVSVKRRDLK